MCDDLGSSSACCAHTRVRYHKDQLGNGCCTDRWECEYCNQRFYPLSYGQMESFQNLRRDLQLELSGRKQDREEHALQLAAISTASIQNTEAAVRERITRENPYWTRAYEDVCIAVDREMSERGMKEEACRRAYGHDFSTTVFNKLAAVYMGV